MRVNFDQEFIAWAMERSGVDPEVLRRRIPRLPKWESGDAQPTMRQLEAFARATHTPIGYFFLPKPPVERVPIPDFRTVANRHISRPSPDLLDTLYICQQRQEWYADFARTMGDSPLPFVGSVSPEEDVISAAARIRTALGLDAEVRSQMRTWTEALSSFIEQSEALGVLVMVSGVVGSNNTRKLDPDEFRGFALIDRLAPVVFLNGSDSKSAQMFTLAHELAHVWVGQTALSDSSVFALPEQRVERWCNQVAAELLVPIDRFRREYRSSMKRDDEMFRLARRFKVSTLVVLRRMYDAGGLSDAVYWDLFDQERSRLLGLPKSSGGDFYRTLGSRAGKRFARALVISTLEGRSSYSEAFRLLGFKKMSTFKELGNSLGLGV